MSAVGRSQCATNPEVAQRVPNRRTIPRSWGSRPSSVRTKVDFPEPLPPNNATASPARTDMADAAQHRKSAQFDRKVLGGQHGAWLLGASSSLSQRRQVGRHDRKVIVSARLVGQALDGIQYVGNADQDHQQSP